MLFFSIRKLLRITERLNLRKFEADKTKTKELLSRRLTKF